MDPDLSTAAARNAHLSNAFIKTRDALNALPGNETDPRIDGLSRIVLAVYEVVRVLSDAAGDL
jgi:hypothetical protein